MFGPTIKISQSLYARLQKAAATKGYSSAEEFALHVLDKAAGDDGDDVTEEQVRKRLKGLGYVE